MNFLCKCALCDSVLRNVAREEVGSFKGLRHLVRLVRLCDFPPHKPYVREEKSCVRSKKEVPPRA